VILLPVLHALLRYGSHCACHVVGTGETELAPEAQGSGEAVFVV